MADNNGKVIVRKKASHHGHHGGAWKVAYADFVTAMMALFIVLWMMSTSKEIQEAVAGYFRDPKGFKEKLGTNRAGSGPGLVLTKRDMNNLKDKLESAMAELPDFGQLKDHVDMVVTGEGLRIELLESETGTFFETGNAQPTEKGRELLELLARELAKVPAAIVVEGHTDSRPFRTTNGYGNWELSVDRANVARKILETSGVDPSRIQEVRGFADRHLRNPKDPLDPANRRITVIVRYEGTRRLSATIDQTAHQQAAATRPAAAQASLQSSPQHREVAARH